MIITDLNTLCSSCGYFESESGVNNGYGCKRQDCEDGDFLDTKGNYINNYDIKIAISLTKRNIKCNKRLAKKFLKKARKMNWETTLKHLRKLGIKYYGKCFSFSCPISYPISFDSLNDYRNSKEYIDIKKEEDMPEGWGDDLMAISVEQANKMNINFK